MKTTEEWLIANLRSVGKCAVVVYLLWSICICVVVQHSTGHSRVHCLRPIERRISSYFQVFAWNLYSTYRVCYCCLTNIFWVHLKNTAFRQYTRVTRLKRFSTLENSAQHTTNQIKDNEVFMNNIAWSHLLVWTHWSRWRRSSRFFPRFPLTASSSFLYGLDPDLQFWMVAI